MGIILGNTYAIEFVKNLAKNYCIMHSIVLEKKKMHEYKKKHTNHSRSSNIFDQSNL